MCGSVFLQGTEPWDPALPQPALERSPVARGYTSTSLHPSQCLAEIASLLALNYFLVFCSSSTVVNPWNFILCLLKPLVWITFMVDDNTARLGALGPQQLLVSLICTVGQGTLTQLPSPIARWANSRLSIQNPSWAGAGLLSEYRSPLT